LWQYFPDKNHFSFFRNNDGFTEIIVMRRNFNKIFFKKNWLLFAFSGINGKRELENGNW